jgi:hypothetical protein
MTVPIIILEGALEGIVLPQKVMYAVLFAGPLGQGYRAINSARRFTKSDNPVVWIVEVGSLALDVTGNRTAAMMLRVSACGLAGSLCINARSFNLTAAMALSNGLLEDQSTAL